MPHLDDIAYAVRISARARRCRVQISRDSVVTLVVPQRMPVARAEQFLRTQLDWVRHHLARRTRVAELLPAGTMLYRGQPVPVRLVETPLSRPQVRREDGGFSIYAAAGRSEDGSRALAYLLRREAAALLASEVEVQSARTGLRPLSLSVRDQRTRWGSCSHSGHVSLNWRLLLAPPEVLSYVVIHELAHLEQPNHGPHFWRLVAQHCPAYEQHRKWLRQHGDLLHRPIGPQL